MNRLKRFILAAFLAVGVSYSNPGFASPSKALPAAPLSYVYDEPSLLSKAGREKLSEILSKEDRDSGNQVIIAIFRSLDQEDLVDYTSRLFKAWKIGDQKKNNGALLTIFLDERKIRIEVGYGLEPVLTDAKSNRIISTIIGPSFKFKKYDEGLIDAAHAIISTIHPDEQSEPVAQPRNSREVPVPPFFILIFFVFIFFSVISRVARSGGTIQRSGYRQDRSNWTWGSGGGDGGFGGFGGGGGGGGFSGGGGSSGGGGASGSW